MLPKPPTGTAGFMAVLVMLLLGGLLGLENWRGTHPTPHTVLPLVMACSVFGSVWPSCGWWTSSGALDDKQLAAT